MDELLTTEQLAKELQVAPATLNNDRYLGRGIPFVRVGRSVRYKRSDILAFIEANRFTRTDTRAVSA